MKKRKIVYYVAASLDGYISGSDGDISGYVSEGNGVDKYLADLREFDTVIMGRNTYEFGYRFGLEPGQPAYPYMDHYIFSNTLAFENRDEKIHVVKPDLEFIDKLRQRPGSDIYLCGGGIFAGWLLDNHKINILKLKLSPVILGNGVKLFGHSKTRAKLNLIEHEKFDFGLQILTFKLEYGS